MSGRKVTLWLLVWVCAQAACQAAREARQLVDPGQVDWKRYCPPGFDNLYRHNCYRHFTFPNAAWTQALTFCKSINTELLTIDNAGENRVISDWIAAKTFPDKSLWLGANSMLGMWSWAGGQSSRWQPLPYTAWGDGGAPDPTSFPTGGDIQCVLATAGRWTKENCNMGHAFVCKLEIDGVVPGATGP